MRSEPGRRPDPRDPAQGQARYRALRRGLGTLAAGAALALAVFAAAGAIAQPWLRATAAEGMVFAGSVLGLALVMLGLNYWYIGRPTTAALAGRSVPEAAPSGRPGPAAWGFLALSAALTGVLLWTEYAFAAEYTLRRAGATALDRALFGEVFPSWAGVAGTVTVIVATFIARGLIGARRRHV